MTHTQNFTPAEDLDKALAAIIRTHGLARVLLAAIGARLNAPPGRTPRRRRPEPKGLSNHLRRDIGLPPVRTPPSHFARFR
ncbi:hypothetical protein [Marinibacterium profundimaris]|uniref:Uncharacterized protein n=1 Tax=Marinibacterium profundimaris TaxID=1679460 RepID=A0A225NMX3_9RHOB|nr:hypothetical protein [Marinibacterium profundimaris]OWU73519.1 hypothetical protein ATO3_12740 [Marinibacterium profundimaris]